MNCLLPGKPWIAMVFVILPFIVIGQDAPVIFKNPASVTHALNIEHLTVFYDDHSGGGLPLEEVKSREFKPLSTRKNDRSEGLDEPKSVTWLHFSIENKTTDTLTLLYNCNMHYSIELYGDNGLIKHYGFFDPAAREDLPVLQINAGATHNYWVKITNYVQSVLPITSLLFTREAYLHEEARESARTIPLLIFCSAVLGCFFFILVFALYHYYLNRDTAFLYYSLSVLMLIHGSLMLMSNRFGIFNWTNHTLIFTYFIFYILFIDRMIGMRKAFPTARILLPVLVGLLVLKQVTSLIESLVLKAPIFSSSLFYKFEIVPGMIVVVLGIAFTLRSKTQLKKYLIIGMLAMLLLGFTPLWLNPFFRMELNAWEAFINFPAAWLALGLVIENICFTMALTFRSHLFEKERISLKETYARNLNEELALRTHKIEQQNKQLEDQKIKQLTAEFDQKLKTIEMTALRAQMNPHFIFNCLNSIKLYTLENNSAMAAEYLTRFSRLIRLVLENSQHDKITLADELETLELYIEMETMRFKKRFNFRRQVDDHIDTSYLEIPPMLIQPYVENAIWHGLMHKQEQGTLTVLVRQEEEHLLKVEVSDDGIGRKRAVEFKSKSATLHKSSGLKMTSDRIALINQRNKNETAVQIEDLVDLEGNALGTKVTITIPL